MGGITTTFRSHACGARPSWPPKKTSRRRCSLRHPLSLRTSLHRRHSSAAAAAPLLRIVQCRHRYPAPPHHAAPPLRCATCSESRSQLHIAQTVPLQTVFSTAYSGILCSWSAPQAPPEAPSTGRKPGMQGKCIIRELTFAKIGCVEDIWKTPSLAYLYDYKQELMLQQFRIVETELLDILLQVND